MTTGPRLHAVYTGRSTNWPVLVAMCALLVPLIVLAAGDGGSWLAPDLLAPLAVILVAVVLAVLMTTSVRATAGPRGVTVHFGVFGWPRLRYPLHRILRADVVDVPASHWTWGVHWTPRRGTMLTLCGGPALRLTLVSGRTVTISTPDPAAAAAAVERARR
jgi:hypothetical protein